MFYNNEADRTVYIGPMSYLIKEKDKHAQDPKDRIEAKGIPKGFVNIGGPTHGYEEVRREKIIIKILKEIGDGWDHDLD